MLELYSQAKLNIEKICIDEKNSGLFQIRTKEAKEILVNRADDVIKSILLKISDICVQNIQRINNLYLEQISII